MRLCVTVRYNHRIKTYMRDVNAVKKASADTSRLSTHLNRAVELFWPDRVAEMKSLLLQTPRDPMSATLKSRSKYEKIISFRCLITGAVCVWQECWNLLQTCKRKTVKPEQYMDEVTESLGKFKTDLIRITEKRQYRQAALCVFSLQSMYLHLQARRLSTFIKNPRLLATLKHICSQFPLTGTTVVVGFDSPAELLQEINTQLRRSFRIYQRDNIEDFLVHLEDYFQPKMKEALEKKTWLVCEQGLVDSMSLQTCSENIMVYSSKTLYFRCVLILRLWNVEILLHFKCFTFQVFLY